MPQTDLKAESECGVEVLSGPLMEVLRISQQFCRGRGTLASPGQAGVRPRKWTEQPVRSVCVWLAGQSGWLEGGVLGRKKAARVGVWGQVGWAKGD